MIPILFIYQDAALLAARLCLAYSLTTSGAGVKNSTAKISLTTIRIVISAALIAGMFTQIAAIAALIWSIIVGVFAVRGKDKAAVRTAVLMAALSLVLATTGGGQYSAAGW